MRTQLFVIIAFVMNLCTAQAQFVADPVPVTAPTTDLFTYRNRVWLSTANDGLYRLTNGGQPGEKQWRLNYEGNIDPHENNGVLRVNQVTVHQDKLFGCTDHGLYGSLDEGQNWQLLKNFQETKPDYPMPADVPVMHLVGSPGKAYVCLQNGSVATSTDGGVTWSDPFTIPETVADSPGASARQAFAWSEGSWYLLTAKRLLRSTNNGQSWQPLPLPVGTATATTLSIQQTNIVVGASEDVYDAGGSTFLGKRVYLHTSRDAGQTWTQTVFTVPLLSGSYEPVAISLLCHANRFYATALGGVWYTDANAHIWMDCRAGLPVKNETTNQSVALSHLLIVNDELNIIHETPTMYSQYWSIATRYHRPLTELTPAHLNAPVLLTAEPVLYSFDNRLTWQNSAPDADGFIIERAEQTPVAFVPIGQVSATTLLFLDSLARTGVPYYYRIRATSQGRSSAWSPVVRCVRSAECVQIKPLAAPRRVEQPDVLTRYALAGEELLKSQNGGRQWQKIDVCQADDARYVDLSFPTPSLGYLLTRDTPDLLKTRDGGVTWTRIRPKLPQVSLTANSVQFVSDSVGYLLASQSSSYYVLYKTTDAGHSFRALPNSPSFMLDVYGIYPGQKLKPLFVGQQTIVGLTNVINNTTQDRLVISLDGGETWQKRVLPIGGTSVHRLYARSAEDIWLLARGLTGTNSDEVFHTLNGGMSWTKIDLPGRAPDPYYPIDVYDIQFADAQHGFVVGGRAGTYSGPGQGPASGYLYRTADGGVTWEVLPVSTTVAMPLNLLSARDGQVAAFGAGQENRTDRITLTSATTGQDWERSNELDNLIPERMAARTPQELYMTGQSQRLTNRDYLWQRTNHYYKSTDGGVSWQSVALAATDQVFEVYFLNANTGFLTTQDAVLVTTDGGQTWQRKATPAPFLPLRTYPDNGRNVRPRTYRKSYFIDPVIWLRISTTNQVFKTTDGGTTWAQLPTPAFTDTPVFSFVTAQIGFCTGQQGVYQGQVYKTTDGGQTWQLRGQGVTIGQEVADLTFRDEQNGFMTDNDLHATTDGGLTWRPVPTGSNSINNRLTIAFVDSTVGYLGGLYKTIDGGVTWNPVAADQYIDKPLAFPDATTVYAFNTSVRLGSVPCNLVSPLPDTLCSQAGRSLTVPLVANYTAKPLRYQWFSLPDSTALPGQTGASLMLTTVPPYSVRSYYCIGTGTCGMTSSSRFVVSGANVLFTLKDGNWSDPAVWSCQRVPTRADRAVLKHEIKVLNTSQANTHQLHFDTIKAKLIYDKQATVLIDGR